MKVGFLHYAYYPTVGGVERVIEQQARLCAQQGHEVTVFSRRGQTTHPNIQVVSVDLLEPDHPVNAAADSELHDFHPGLRFSAAVEEFFQCWKRMFADIDVLVVHNMLTLHFNLAATAALHRVAEELQLPMINWIHDYAVLNPHYHLGSGDLFPWSLLRKFPERSLPVAVSDLRQRQYAEVTRRPIEECRMIPNGIDPSSLLALPGPLAELLEAARIWERDVVLFHPTRILPRKNVEYSIYVLTELRRRKKDALLLITGAPDPYNAASEEYRESLKQLMADRAVDADVLFVGEKIPVGDAELAGLYAASDGLIFPSHQEGFGLPVLEAVVHRIPVFAPNIRPLADLTAASAVLFEPGEEPATVARMITDHLARERSLRERREFVRRYGWNTLYEAKIEPLLREAVRTWA